MFHPCLPRSRRNSTLRILVQVLGVGAMVIVAAGGGLLNRVRGGWGNCPNPQLYLLDGGVLTHDGFPRFLVAGMTGLLAALLCSLRWPLPKRFSRRGASSERWDGPAWPVHIFGRLVVGAIVTFMVYFGLFVGWGVYYSIGRNEDGYTSRPGVFDYLIGKECEGWPFSRRWLLEYTGMSLRGLVQTVPVGFVLGLAVGGLGPLLEERPVGSTCQHSDDQRRGVSCGLSVMLSGLCMGLMYELGWDTPSSVPNFSTGTELGELYWGMWSWWMVMLPLVTYARGYSRYGYCCPSAMASKYGSLQDDKEVAPLPLAEGRASCEGTTPLRTWTWRDDLRKLGMSCLVVFCLALFLGSAVTYGRLKQGDSTNKNQSWIGICQALGTVLLLQGTSSFAIWLSSIRPPSFRSISPVKDCVLCFATVPEELLLASRRLQKSSGDDFISKEDTSLMGLPMAHETGLQRRRINSPSAQSLLPETAVRQGRRWWRETLRVFLCEGRQPYAFILTVFNFICLIQLLIVGCTLLMDIVGNWALGSCNIGITASYEAQA